MTPEQKAAERRPCCFIIAEDSAKCPRLARWGAYWWDHGPRSIATYACDTHLVKLIPDDGREVHVSALEVQAIDALADLATGS